jgi:hypothetical protein
MTFSKLIQADKDTKITELAMTARRDIAMSPEVSRAAGRRGYVPWCSGQLSLKPKSEIQLIVSEIAFLGGAAWTSIS